MYGFYFFFFFFSSRRRHTRCLSDWSSDVCSSDLSLVAGAVAGHGVLHKTNPAEYPANSRDGVRVGSTVEYPNTAAVVLGMGIALGLGRMTQLRTPFSRGLYAAFILVLGVILYTTFSRGGMVALATGLVVLFAVGERRLQMFMNLLLVLGPLLWLVWSVQGLETFFESVSDESLAAADGSAFQTDLVIAVLAAFTLQLAYAFLVGRYELVPALQRVLGIAAVVAVLAGMGYVGLVVLGEQRGSGDILGAFTRD